MTCFYIGNRSRTLCGSSLTSADAFHAANVDTPVPLMVDCTGCFRHINTATGRVVTHNTVTCPSFSIGVHVDLGSTPTCQHCLALMNPDFTVQATGWSGSDTTPARINNGGSAEGWGRDTTDTKELERRISSLESACRALTALLMDAGILKDTKAGEYMKILESGKQLPFDLYKGRVYVAMTCEHRGQPRTLWDQLDEE